MMAAGGDINDVEMGLLEGQNDEDFLNKLERLERRLRVERMVRSQLRQSKWELWGRRVAPAITWVYRACVLITLLLLLEQEGKKGYFYYGGSEVVGMTGVNPRMEHVKMNDSHLRVKRWDFLDFDSSKGSSDDSTKPGSGEVISEAKMETGILAQDLQEGDLDLNLSTISEESRGVLSSILGHKISDEELKIMLGWAESNRNRLLSDDTDGEAPPSGMSRAECLEMEQSLKKLKEENDKAASEMERVPCVCPSKLGQSSPFLVASTVMFWSFIGIFIVGAGCGMARKFKK